MSERKKNEAFNKVNGCDSKYSSNHRDYIKQNNYTELEEIRNSLPSDEINNRTAFPIKRNTIKNVHNEVSCFPTKIFYTDEELEQWKLLFERFGSYKKISNFLKSSNLRHAAPQTIKKNLKVYISKLGLNYEEWYSEHHLNSLYSHRYTEEEITEWVLLFERIGTLLGVVRFLRRRDGKAPSPTTIKESIVRKFERQGRDFEMWYRKFHKRPTSIIPYSEEDEIQWEKLFEKLGSFSAVARYIKERNNGMGPSHITIIKHLKKRFKREHRDFNKWVKLYHIKYTDIEGYSEEEVHEWKLLFEEFGKIKEVINYLEEEYGISPDKKTVMRRLRQKFKKENMNFNIWYKKYDKSNVHWYYTPEQVQIMIQLYEVYGSFEAVQDQLESEYGIQIHPSTIKNNIMKYYNLYGLNFITWLKTYDRVYYYEQEVKKWEKLYQWIGSFIGVYKYLKNFTDKAPSPTTIERRLRKKFLDEKRDFKKFKIVYFQAYHESIAREYFNRIFNAHFLKIRPKWLINPDTGRRLELDGYNQLLKIAFEFNGVQHYEYFERYHQSIQVFYDQLKRDEYKVKICEDNNIILIIIPYTVKPSEMQDFIIDTFNELTGEDLHDLYKKELGREMPIFNHNYFFHQESLDEYL